MKNTYLKISIIILIFSILSMAQINVGEKAPDFELLDKDGKIFKLSNCRDNIVLLFFMGYNCSICKADAPDIEKLHKEWVDDGVKVVGVDIWDGSPTSLQTQFVSATNSSYNFLTYGSNVGRRYGMNVSNFALIGIDGNIKYISYSFKENEIESLISNLKSDPGQKPKTVPESFYLEQNYPNPFNPETQIDYEIRTETPAQVKLVVYDVLGNRVNELVNTRQASGFYSVNWNGTNEAGVSMPTGFYFYMLESNGSSEMKKMLLLK